MVKNSLHELLLTALIGKMPLDIKSGNIFILKTDTRILCDFLGVNDHHDIEQEFDEIRSQYVLSVSGCDYVPVWIYADSSINEDICEFSFTRDFIYMYQAGLKELERIYQDDKK